MLARKLGNYRLYMAGTTQNKQKCLIFIVVPKGGENFNQIRSKGRKLNVKKINSNNNNNNNNNDKNTFGL